MDKYLLTQISHTTQTRSYSLTQNAHARTHVFVCTQTHACSHTDTCMYVHTHARMHAHTQRAFVATAYIHLITFSIINVCTSEVKSMQVHTAFDKPTGQLVQNVYNNMTKKTYIHTHYTTYNTRNSMYTHTPAQYHQSTQKYSNTRKQIVHTNQKTKQTKYNLHKI